MMKHSCLLRDTKQFVYFWHYQCLKNGCNGGSVTGSRHSQYTESNVYSSCIRVELGCLYMLVMCSIGCTSHQSLILYIVAINIYNITRLNRGTGDPLQSSIKVVHSIHAEGRRAWQSGPAVTHTERKVAAI